MPTATPSPTASPAQTALANLEAWADATGTNALLVARGDAVMRERYSDASADSQLGLMSVTKSVTAIAIGMLIDDGKIPSLDTPVSTWFPTWREGEKARVTLRHVLLHQSGLHHVASAASLYAQPDRLAYVLALPLDETPGTTFSYSNEATQLLAGIVRAASGKPLDVFLGERLFRPLGIERWTWHQDEAGNVDCFGGLALSGRDCLKLGQLMLHRGNWKGRQLVSQGWVAASTTAQPNTYGQYGYMWWVKRPRGLVVQRPAYVEELTKGGLAWASKLAPLDGLHRGFDAYYAAARPLLTDEEYNAFRHLGQRTPVSYYPDKPLFLAVGSFGQFIVVDPVSDTVVVRLKRKPASGQPRDDADMKEMRELPSLVRELAGPQAVPAAAGPKD